MKKLKYFFQFFFIMLFFIIFKLIGHKLSIKFSGYIFFIFGHFFRSNKLAETNLKKAFPLMSLIERKKILKNMWFNYGAIFSEYAFIKKFSCKKNYFSKIKVENYEIINELKKVNEPVIFISGHFSNFELMAMCIEKFGINLAAIYRPLNNIFLNPVMEKIRKKYICKNQIKKGRAGTKDLLKKFKKNTSVALMIDQRVSEGINSNFFNHSALTTTIPAQFVKKYNIKIVPVYIERLKQNNFKLKFYNPIKFEKIDNIQTITDHLNRVLEKMIIRNPSQWIWTHNRWK